MLEAVTCPAVCSRDERLIGCSIPHNPPLTMACPPQVLERRVFLQHLHRSCGFRASLLSTRGTIAATNHRYHALHSSQPHIFTHLQCFFTFHSYLKSLRTLGQYVRAQREARCTIKVHVCSRGYPALYTLQPLKIPVTSSQHPDISPLSHSGAV